MDQLSQIKDQLSGFDQIVVWYGTLPGAAKSAITLVVGAVLAYVAFKVVIRIVKTVLHAVIAAVLAFLIGTVPGNLILNQAYGRLEERFGATISQMTQAASARANQAGWLDRLG
ncbi:hypothetical protein [Bifidobacterium avesanii]|uniref:Uncharacterized protein n=1 Tax=Bifidobacterium avesanii TaxID=1798157 RepID=A0A7K3TJF8_9BIFI|nr:hypothetical protein [Bifidobacterium avesanii]KAB8292797.1 hypothetical protein DSM100685_0808 [Bifidobacterium avesanii]NEG78403.1 hypothetical protein [Bifidobacterium avesanii]